MRSIIRHSTIWLSLLVFSVACCTICSTNASAVEPVSSVKSSLSELQSWLGSQQYGKGWSTYLNLEDLEKQVALGGEADKKSVKEILENFQSGVNGLELKRFAAVRVDLEQWYGVLAMPSAAELAATASEVKSEIQVPTAADVKSALENLYAAMKSLEPILDTSNVEKETWREYLQWKDLNEVLKAEKVDIGILNEFLTLMSEDVVGFEDSRFITVRARLKDFINLTSIVNNAESKKIVQTQLDALSAELKRYNESHQGADARLIGLRLGFLNQINQVPSFVSAVRHYYCKPNLYVNVNDRFLNAAMYRKIDEKAPVNQFILGTDISGTGHTVGEVSLEMVPSDNQAIFEATMHGTTKTDTIGYNGPVTIYSSSNVTLSARKRLVLDRNGITIYGTQARADVNTTINSIAAKRCIIEKIAWRKAGKQKACAEAIAAELAEERLAKRFDKEAEPQLLDAQQRFQNNFRAPLMRHDAFPEMLQFGTSKRGMTLVAMQAGGDQLGAPDVPVARDVKSDISVQVHESWVNNFTSSILGGQTLTEKKVQQFYLDRTGKIPEELRSQEGKDPWEITFAKKDPVIVAFADGAFKVTIQGREYKSGERSFGKMNITATYKVQKADKSFKLVRDGELVILPPNYKEGKKLSTEQINLRTILRDRLGKVLKEEIVPKNIDLAGEFEYVDELVPNLLHSKGGWMSLGWNAVINK